MKEVEVWECVIQSPSGAGFHIKFITQCGKGVLQLQPIADELREVNECYRDVVIIEAKSMGRAYML